MNVSSLTPVGSGSAEMVKSWNWPGGIRPPDQVTSETAWVNRPSSVTIGLLRVMSFTVIFQPGTGLTSTWAIG